MENKYVVVNCCDVLSCIPVTTRLSLSSSPDLGVHVRVEENSKLTSKRLHTLGVNTARVRKSCDGFGVQRWTHYSLVNSIKTADSSSANLEFVSF